jgi:UDP-glucose 4-epimerase
VRVLLTGASSFTGFWFAKTLMEANVEVVAPLRGKPQDYFGVRGERVALLQHWAKVVPECPFGGDAFLDLARSREYDALCHHAAEVADYRSPDFDVIGAVAANTLNLRQTLLALRDKGLKAVVATGSVFEADEGVGPEPRRAFSPYGLSKGLTYQAIQYWGEALGVPVSKFVIANPFGALEEPRFVSHVIGAWAKGEAVEVRTPRYLRDNIHVDLLARAYARFVSEACAGGAGRCFGPCGYLETQGAFAERLSRELAPRLGVEGRVRLAEQTDFSEPLARVNRDQINPAAYGWSESAAWDLLAEFWRRRGFNGAKAQPATGPSVEILGAVDSVDNTAVAGWLTDKQGANPRYARILVDGTEQGVTRADLYRQDLADKQISDGYSAFRFLFARMLDPYVEHVVRVEDRDSGKSFGPPSLRAPKLVGGAGSPFACDRDFVAINVGTAHYQADHVDVLLEVFGRATRFATPTSTSAKLELLETHPISRRYYEALDLPAMHVKVRARPDPSCSTFDIHFSEADALPEAARITCRNIVPARPPAYLGSVTRENMERVSGPGEDLGRFAAGGLATAYRIGELVKHHFGRALSECGRVLDWGAGAGRVAAPLARVVAPGLRLTATDVDAFNVGSGRTQFPDIEFVNCPFLPPLPFDDGAFGAIYGVSVFTHLTESVQFAWLRELRRLVRPGAPVIVSVHSEFQLFRAAETQPDILAEALRRGISDLVMDINLGPKLAEPNYYRATFHTRRYIEQNWTQGFEIVQIHTAGNLQAQDFVVLRAM